MTATTRQRQREKEQMDKAKEGYVDETEITDPDVARIVRRGKVLDGVSG